MEAIFKADISPSPNMFYHIFCVFLTEHNKYISNVNLYWRTVVHGLALAQHGYVFAYAQSIDFSEFEDDRIKDLKSYGPRYLTGWNIAFQVIFLLLALRHDVAEWCGNAHTTTMLQVRFWRDTVFNALVVPYTLFVSSMFWGLFSIDREIVFPTIFDAVVPTWFNHCVHTSILLLVVLEMGLQERCRPSNHVLNYALCWFFSILYAVVYYTTYYEIGRWLYPVFGLMTWWQVILYQLGIWFSIHLFYESQWPFVRMVHGDCGEGKHECLGKRLDSKDVNEEDFRERKYYVEDFVNANILDLFKEKVTDESFCKCIGQCMCG